MGLMRRLLTPLVHRTLREMLSEMQERIVRLETQQLDQLTEHAALRDSHMKVLKRTVGALGGRPPAGKSVTSDLDSIPKGDKDALRRYFADEIARRGPRAHQEN